MFGSERKKIERLHFVIIGAQKSGTTALHHLMEKHPDIALGDQQEIHFFDDENIFAKPPDYELLHRHFPALPASAVVGDCTPSYLYWKPAAERIRQYNPAIKLLALLRNPIDRAFAHWNMQRFKGREPLDFLDAIKEETNRIAPPLSIESRRFSYVDRGFYTTQLERFLKVFPREQLLIVKSEQFRGRQLDTMNAIFHFLGVKPIKSIRSKDHNVVPYQREMTSEERKYLYEIFAEEIRDVERLLGWNCSDWKL